MMVKETKNMDEIKSIIFHPTIHPHIEDDDNKVVDLPVKDSKYIGCYIDDKIVGVGMFHKVEGLTVCHMHLLKEYRKTIGLEFGLEAIKLRPDDVLYTNVDETFPNIMRYVEALGFKLIDTVKKCVKKDGLFYDSNVYKLDFSEVK
jgi:hypothetical protein